MPSGQGPRYLGSLLQAGVTLSTEGLIHFPSSPPSPCWAGAEQSSWCSIPSAGVMWTAGWGWGGFCKRQQVLQRHDRGRWSASYFSPQCPGVCAPGAGDRAWQGLRQLFSPPLLRAAGSSLDSSAHPDPDLPRAGSIQLPPQGTGACPAPGSCRTRRGRGPYPAGIQLPVPTA